MKLVIEAAVEVVICIAAILKVIKKKDRLSSQVQHNQRKNF